MTIHKSVETLCRENCCCPAACSRAAGRRSLQRVARFERSEPSKFSILNGRCLPPTTSGRFAQIARRVSLTEHHAYLKRYTRTPHIFFAQKSHSPANRAQANAGWHGGGDRRLAVSRKAVRNGIDDLPILRVRQYSITAPNSQCPWGAGGVGWLCSRDVS